MQSLWYCLQLHRWQVWTLWKLTLVCIGNKYTFKSTWSRLDPKQRTLLGQFTTLAATKKGTQAHKHVVHLLVRFIVQFSNTSTGGPTSLTASSLRARTVLSWYGTRTASGTTCRATTIWPSLARREQVRVRPAPKHLWPRKKLFRFQPNLHTSHPGCVSSGLQPTPPGGERAHLRTEAREIRNQLSREVPVSERIHPAAPSHNSLPRQRTLGRPQDQLHNP